MALDELQDQKSLVSSLRRMHIWSYRHWRCKVEKNTAHLFRNNFPVNLQVIMQKSTSNSQGFLSHYFGEWVSCFAMAKTFMLASKRSNAHGAVFGPTGCLRSGWFICTRNRLGQIPSHHKIRMLNPWKKTGYCHIVINHWLHPKEKSVMVTTWSMGEWGMAIPLQNDSCYD